MDFSYRIISSFFPPNNLCGVQSLVLSGTEPSILRTHKPVNGASPFPWDAPMSPLVCSLALAICRKKTEEKLPYKVNPRGLASILSHPPISMSVGRVGAAGRSRWKDPERPDPP